MKCGEAWRDLEIIKYRIRRWLDSEDTMRLILTTYEKLLGKPIVDAVNDPAVSRALMLYALACLGKRPRRDEVEQLVKDLEQRFSQCG